MTAPRADVAEYEERRRTGIPTFPPIRTASLLADRVQVEPLHGVLEIKIVRAGLGSNFEPGRKTRATERGRLKALSVS